MITTTTAKTDGKPGESWANPLWYRGYKIYAQTNGALPLSYGFSHDDFDGAPDAHDYRNGWARTVDEAKAEIDDIEDM